jgi:hypothetical protein
MGIYLEARLEKQIQMKRKQIQMKREQNCTIEESKAKSLKK